MRSWIVEIVDAGDGSGDVIVPIPQEALDELGWDDETLLVIEDTGEGAVIRPAGEEEPCN